MREQEIAGRKGETRVVVKKQNKMNESRKKADHEYKQETRIARRRIRREKETHEMIVITGYRHLVKGGYSSDDQGSVSARMIE